MLAERNENKRVADLPATKHHAHPRNYKKFHKENKVLLNNPYTSISSSKQHARLVEDDPNRNLLVVETNKIKATNLKKILAFDLSKSKGNYKSDFLRKHRTPVDIRTRMVS